MKKVLVTGGAGYIGSVLVRELLKKGYAVRVFDLLLYGNDSLNELVNKKNFELIHGDIRNVEKFPGLFEGIYAVIHLAALSNDPSCDLDPEYTKSVNTEGTRKLALMCKKHKIRRFVFSSSCSVYGSGVTGQLREYSITKPVSLYAKTKLEGEKLLFNMIDKDFSPCFLRNATVFGLSPRIRFDLVVNIMTKHALENKKIFILSKGEQWRPLVHVKDVADAFIRTLEMPLDKIKGQVFNIGSNSLNFQVYKVAELVKDCLPETEVEYVPSADEDRRSYNVNFDKASDVLNFKTKRTVRDGIREIVEAVKTGKLADLNSNKHVNLKTMVNFFSKPALEGGEPVRKHFLPFSLPSIGKEEEEEVIGTLRSGWITMGPKTKLFEEKIRDYLKVKHVVAVNSCTAALHLSLVALGVKPGEEVITTPITFATTANVIEHVGAKPVFADIDRETLNIDPSKIEEKITEKTRAIIPVHLAGNPCDMDKIRKISRKHNIAIVEDAAHALGAEYNGKRVGYTNDAATFSFYPTKNITTIEGGIITSNNKGFIEKARLLSLYGISKDAWKRYTKECSQQWEVILPGYKYHMTDIQASLGIHQIDKLDKFLQARESYTEIYNEAFESIPEIIIPKDQKGARHSRHLYPIILDIDKLNIDRDKFMLAMKRENIGTGIHFTSLPLHKYYRETYGYKRGDFPNADYISDRIVSIPLYPKMTDEDIRDVIGAVKKILAFYRKK